MQLSPHLQRSSFVPSWKSIPDWPQYEVSDQGDVRRGGRILTRQREGHGYTRVTLCDEPNGRRKTAMIHSLVALAFIGQRPTKRHQVDHINRDRTDNRLSNLRYVFPRENRQNGAIAPGSKNGCAILSEAKVLALRELYDDGFATVEELAKTFGVSRQTVTKIGKRRGWTHV